MNSETLIKTSVLRIGTVSAVEGRSIRIKVDKAKNASHLLFNGRPLKNVSVGSYVKITKGYEQIIGKIEGEYTEEDRFVSTKKYKDDKEKIRRTLKISLLGFYEGGLFQRGIREMPLIENECFLLDENEFAEIHDFVSKEDAPMTVGHLAMEKGMPVSIGVNSLFASHIGIFGNTGSGKSYTLAKIYNQLFSMYGRNNAFKNNAEFFLIDFNGEYVDARGPEHDNVIASAEQKRVYRLSTKPGGQDKYPITAEMLNDPTIWMIVLEATEKTQAPFIRRALESNFIEEKLASADDAKKFINDTVLAMTTFKDKGIERGLVINFLTDIKWASNRFGDNFDAPINYFNTHLKYNNTLNSFYLVDQGTTYSSEDAFKTKIDAALANLRLNMDQAGPIDRIRLKILFNYYDEIVRGYSNKEHISPLIKRLPRRIEDISKVIALDPQTAEETDKNLTVVSLKDVNVHMRKMLPLLFCKHLYERKKDENRKDKYLSLIVDEAHNILSSSSQRESEQWKDYRLETFEEIIKEGRKFGVFLTIASQRPYDISPTIISQLHNYFLHRLINNNDIEAIEKTVAYLDKVSFESLSILPTGTCVLAGLVAQIPVIVDIDRIDEKFKPFNQTISPTTHWND